MIRRSSSVLLSRAARLALLLVPIALAAWSTGDHAATSALPSAASTASQPARIASEPAGFYTTPFEHKPDVKTLTALGRALFHDAALSASGRMSCASCHDPAHAYGPADARPVQFGGPTGRLPGLRAVPSLKYHQDMTPFSEHFYDNDGNDSEDQGPTGGFDWDGRAFSAHEQAAGPLLSTFEMANADPESVVAKLQASPDADAFRAAFGAHVFDTPQHAWNGLVLALEVFQQSPADFYPYDSKYDEYTRGKVKLSPAEMRGLLVFNDVTKGNCALCHPSAPKRGAAPQFTDQGFIALGVPRNPAIPANAKAGYVDLGLCGPLRTDLRDHAEYCGLFRTPTLRNVALRPVFFHNGVYQHLDDVVRFYAQRDTRPERFYPRGKDGQVRKYDDLPAKARANVNDEQPFGGKPGDKPAMTDAEVVDVVAFLKTLTDGYVAPKK